MVESESCAVCFISWNHNVLFTFLSFLFQSVQKDAKMAKKKGKVDLEELKQEVAMVSKQFFFKYIYILEMTLKLKRLNYALIEKMIIEKKLSPFCSICSQTCPGKRRAR